MLEMNYSISVEDVALSREIFVVTKLVWEYY